MAVAFDTGGFVGWGGDGTGATDGKADGGAGWYLRMARRRGQGRGTVVANPEGDRAGVIVRACRMTPLLGQFMLGATWANVREHAAGPPDYWGSRGRGFKSRRPDIVRGQLSWPFVLTTAYVLIVS